jgi:hypothetical protein
MYRFRPFTGHEALRESRGIAYSVFDLGTRRGWGVSVTPRPHSTPQKDLVPIVQEAGWAPGSVWTGAENLAPTGIRSPDRPSRSQSLYRLSYQPTKAMYNPIIYSVSHCAICFLSLIFPSHRHQYSPQHLFLKAAGLLTDQVSHSYKQIWL